MEKKKLKNPDITQKVTQSGWCWGETDILKSVKDIWGGSDDSIDTLQLNYQKQMKVSNMSNENMVLEPVSQSTRLDI